MSIVKQSLVGASGQGGGYTINDSLRFRLTGALYRTFGTPTDNNKWTYSVWFKRGNLDNVNTLFGRYVGANDFIRGDFISKSFRLFQYQGSTPYPILVTTDAVFRDVSAWYHLTIAIDTSNATAADRVIYYVNGVRVTAFSSATYPSLNLATTWNVSGGVVHRIGALTTGDTDGYMTEINFIDGQALTADDFGEFDDNGTWKPLAYTGTYGNNGFYIDATTSGTAVLDQSGNSNNWSSTNMDFTTSTATTYDLMKDTPSLVDENAANFCTLNPLDKYSSAVIAEGNLKIGANNNSWTNQARSTFFVSSGKWYWEVTFSPGTGSFWKAGIRDAEAALTSNTTSSTGYEYYAYNGNKQATGVNSSYGSGLTAGDVLAFALDMDAGTITAYKNNTSLGVMFSGLSGSYSPTVSMYNSFISLNFGQRPFAYTPPTGFLKLNTFNLPDSTIEDGSDYFNTVLYTGDSTSSHAITGVGFQPDWVWIKNRSATYSHCLADSVRGITRSLSSNLTAAEVNYGNVSSVQSDGFTVNGNQLVNGSGNALVAWNWKANGSGVSNTVGTIPSTVSANTTAGFSIVTYTGNGILGATVGHGLGASLGLLITKPRSISGGWALASTGLGTTGDTLGGFPESFYIALNATGGKSNNGSSVLALGDTTKFAIGNGLEMNQSSATYVAYCFAPVEGYSAFGSYTGNGSTDGPFVYTGFRPAWIMIRRTDTTGNWQIQDSSRTPFNWTCNALFADSAGAENTSELQSTYGRDYLSNGFKIRSSHTSHNTNGGTYIYMAFAENPFKNANAR